MKKKLIATILTATCLSLPVSAEIQTYEDDYVKFQYDDSAPCYARVITMSKNISFMFDTAVTSEENNSAVFVISRDKDEPDRLVYPKDKKLGGYDACQLFLDSFEVKTDSVIDAEYDGSSDILIHIDCYSEQAIKYAQKALEICNDYLDMKLSGSDAAEQIKELQKRAESYSEDSDYKYDSDAKWVLFNEDYNFKYGKDPEVIELKEDLERMLG